MKRLFVFPIMLILLLLTACTKGESTKADHLTVYGLTLGASVEEVTSELGLPAEKHVTNISENENYIVYSYPRLFLGFKNDKLVFISTDDPEFGTDKGIYINDDKRKVLQKYKGDKIFCMECSQKKQTITDFEHLTEFFYIEDDDVRIVFGGEGSKIDFIQAGKNMPYHMMFVHSLNPELENKRTLEEIKSQSLKISKDLHNKLVKQYSNYTKIAKKKFTKEALNQDLIETASKGKLPGFPFKLGDAYKDVIDYLGAPDHCGILGEGSYNLIYGSFDAAFNYTDLIDENKNLDTKILVLTQRIDAPILGADIMRELGNYDDYYVNELDGTGNLVYQVGNYELTFTLDANDPENALIHEYKVIGTSLREVPNSQAWKDFIPRYEFQVTGTDGEEYKLYIYSENEETSPISDDSWFTSGAYMFTGEYFAALTKHGDGNLEKQSLSLGVNTFVPQDETSTASIVYAENGPDLLVITQKDSATFTNYKTYIIKNGELKEIPFYYKGERIEDLYIKGIRNATYDTWETIMFSNISEEPWLRSVWRIDLNAEIFRDVKDTRHSSHPWE